MPRRRRLPRLRVVVDTSVLVRGIRAFRQQPPGPETPELTLLGGWAEEPDAFDWLYSEEILTLMVPT